MLSLPPRLSTSSSLRMARKAWRLLYRDSKQCIALANEALSHAQAAGDIQAEGWARLVRGMHLIWYATPQAATQELVTAERCFTAAQDRPGYCSPKWASHVAYGVAASAVSRSNE